MSKLEDLKIQLREKIDAESYLVVTSALADELAVSEAVLHRAVRLLILGEYSLYYVLDNNRKMAKVLVPSEATYKSVVERRDEIFPA